MKTNHLFFALVAASLATTAQAQVKVGANPTNITTNGVLDVEGSAGRSVFFQNGNVGINTTAVGSTSANTGKTAEISSGAAGMSGLRFTNLNSGSSAATSGTSYLGVNATGDVVVTTGAAARQYLAASRTGSGQVVTTSGVDIIINSIQSTNNTIPFNGSTGVATLTVGKTYLITASMHVFPFTKSTYLQYSIVNAITNVPVNSSASAELLNTAGLIPSASSGTITTIYTPIEGQQTIKMRVGYIQDQGGASATIRSDLFSGFTITEL